MKCKKCDSVLDKMTVKKNSVNQGRQFYSCKNPVTACNFFIWADGKPSQITQKRSMTTASVVGNTSSVPIENTLVLYTDGACLGKFAVICFILVIIWQEIHELQ